MADAEMHHPTHGNLRKSRFQLQRLDGRVRIWRKQHGSMDPSCLVSTVQAAAGVRVWGIFSRHTLGPSVPTEHCSNSRVLLLTTSIPL